MNFSLCLTLIEQLGSLKAPQKPLYGCFLLFKKQKVRFVSLCFVIRIPNFYSYGQLQKMLSCFVLYFLTTFIISTYIGFLRAHKIMCACAITIRHKELCDFITYCQYWTFNGTVLVFATGSRP